jgi:hypothetical protein
MHHPEAREKVSSPERSADWYRVDIQALTYGEYWHLSPGVLVFLIAAVRKFLGSALRINFRVAHPRLYRFLEADEVPPDVHRRLCRLAEQAVQEGFEPQLFAEAPRLESHRACFGHFLLGDDGRVAITIAHFRNQGTTQTAPQVASILEDGLIVSTTAYYSLLLPPDVESVLLPGASLEVLLRKHCRRLSRHEEAGRYAVRIKPAQLQGLIREREQVTFDFHLNRGVLVPMTEDEIAAAQAE